MPNASVNARLPLRVAVIGLGVAGGVVAAGLAGRPDVELIAVEKVGPDDHDHAGNGLNVGPNAMGALAATLPALARDLQAASLPWRQWRAALSGGRLLYFIPLEEVAETDGIRIRWSELYRAIRAPLRRLARFRARIEDVAITPGRRRGAISFTLIDDVTGARKRIEGIDLLIAADGRYSPLRERLLGTPATRFLGVANFRLLLPDADASGIDDLEQFYTGPNRLLAFRLADGVVYLSGNLPTDANGEVPEGCADRNRLCAAYRPHAGAPDPSCAWLIDALARCEGPLHWSRAQEIDAAYRDTSGHVLFLGDASHAMAPTLGQGATQAIEDGCALLTSFAEAAAHRFDAPAFTAAFEAARAERIAFVSRFSWDASAPLLQGADPVRATAGRDGPDHRAKLRRLYTDTPLAMARAKDRVS